MSSARQFGAPATFTSFIDTPTTPKNLFPFTSSYGFWAGDCSAEDPANNGSNPGATSGRINPGQTTNVTITLPSINFKAQLSSSTSPVAGAEVWFSPQTPGGGSAPTPAGLTNASGQIAFPAVPYGSYNACGHLYLDAATAAAMSAQYHTTIAPGDYKKVTS